MPPAYDLIIERGGAIVVETIEACDEDAAWRAGLMLHIEALMAVVCSCLLYTSPSPRDRSLSRMPSSA